MIDPHRLSEKVGNPYELTDQQAKVIAADPNRPAVVIAGAGSGKTTTMSDRVLWLIANGHAQPHQILGLTFTRKAAASLSAKIRSGIAALVKSGLIGEIDGEPTVLTYHAYGQRVLEEHALRIGMEPPGRPVRDAAIWQMAERMVARYTGDMSATTRRLPGVVEAVIALSDQMSEHAIDPAALEKFSADFMAHAESLSGRATKPLTTAMAIQRERIALLPLVTQLLAARRDSAQLSFGDQMTLAAHLAERVPEAGEWERSRFSHVLLDEYQDTSQSQLMLMRSLFGGGHPVMAVGDPLQAIYGWRGASTGTIEAFRHDFVARDGTLADEYLLTTSWRNDRTILTVANSFADSLRQRGFVVHELVERKDVSPGLVNLGLYETTHDEAEAVAAWVQARWDQRRKSETCAVLVRSRPQIEAIERALLSRELPVEVVGMSGLLATPEVIEIHSILQILFQPTSGPAVMRALAGPRWRVGPRDLVALHRYAGFLSKKESDQPEAESLTVIEAIEEIERAPRDWFSIAGRERLIAFSRELRHLRKRSSLALPELLVEIERAIGLHTEIAALPQERAVRARAHIDAFLDQAHEFADLGGGPVAFLSWLEAAAHHERGLTLSGIEVSPEAIQILTIHAAKGLEWDNVVIPGLRSDAFPIRGQGSESWIKDVSVVPFPLRGDSGQLPILGTATTAKEFVDALNEFEETCQDRALIEEERLAYVALTRPKHALLLTSSWWANGVTLRGPSEIFLAARDALSPEAILHDAPRPLEDVRTNERIQVSWPTDPLGARREELAERAERVLQADGEAESDEGKQWLAEATMLLRERSQSMPTVFLPPRLSVSALVQLRSDPNELARRLRRPMPFKPDALARRGTAFHRWLEERFASRALFDLDEFSEEESENRAELVTLQEAWLASVWANLAPHEVEVPFDLVVDGVLIRGRMDAVYQDGGSWEIVDWKTGPPKTGADLEAAAVQLAMYRLAWSRIANVPLTSVSAAFHHVAANVTVRPADMLDEAGLIALIRTIPE